MPVKKKPKVSDPNNPHHRKTKNHKTKQKSNSIDSLSRNQISFFKAKYISLVTEIFISYAKHQTGYKKVGTLTHELIAADVVLQYLEKHCMQLTLQNAICESSRDLKRLFADIWIARKLQIRGKHDIIHGLVLAKKNNKFNVGFHGVIGNKNNSANNINNDEATNQKQKNIKLSKKESNDSIKLLNVRVIEQTSNNDTQKTLKKRRKKINSQQQQENEQNLIDQSKPTKGNSKKNSKNESDQGQAKIPSKKRRKTKKDGMNDFDPNDDNESSIKQQDEFLPIEISSIKFKDNRLKNNHQPILKNNDDNSNYDDISDNNNNDDINLDELPPPLGTDSSDDNGELFGMNNQYNYDNGIENKNDDNFDDGLFDKSNEFNNSFNDENTYLKERFNNKTNDFNNRFEVKRDKFDEKFNKKNKFIDDRFDNQNDNYNNKFDNKNKFLDDRFDVKEANFEDNYNENKFIHPSNQKKLKKDSKNGKTRNRSIGSHTHVRTSSGQNSNNINRTKQKPENHLNEISHFYTYTYEEEDEYSESTQYEYPTHIQYEDMDEEEEDKNNNNYNKNSKNSHPDKKPIFAYEESLITGEIEIQSQEIDHFNPILDPISNSIENKKNKNKVLNANNSYPSSGSPQNHSTSSNSLHEQKIKLTLQQNVEMIQNSPQDEKKQPKMKEKIKTKSSENSQIIQEDEPSIKEIQLVFETFHTVDVQPDLEKQRLFKQRKGNKQRQKEIGNVDSPRNSTEQIYFPIAQNNQNNSKLTENQTKKVQQTEPIQKVNNNKEAENLITQNPVNIHIKIVEAVIFKDSGLESNIFKVRIKLASAREFAETRESTPSPIQPLPDTNQLIAHHLWDESFKIFCTSTNAEEINVSVLALRNKKQQKQKIFDIVSTAKIASKSFVIDEISDVWINMKNIGRIHLLVCIKNFNPNEDEDEMYNEEEEEEEEEEAEMSDDGNEVLNNDFVTKENVEYDDIEEENENS